MNLRIVRTIFTKEMVDTLRDKRTLIAMVAVPALLYPGLLIFSSQTAMMHQTRIEGQVSRAAIVGDAPGPVREWVAGIELVELAGLPDGGDPETALLRGEVDAVVVVKGDVDRELESGGAIEIEILFDTVESESRLASTRIEEGLEPHIEELQRGRLEQIGVSEDYVNPVRISETNVAPPAKTTGTLVGMILPLIMVAMIGVGALYPAIDLTAGEKERGTFETLLATPAGKFEIVCGKFLTVASLAMLTGLLNLASMLLTFVYVMGQLSSDAMPLQVEMPAYAVAVIVLIMAPLSFLISAGMMAAAVLARSFKEAQNFVTPVLLLILMPAGLASLPGMKLTAGTQFIPITNVALLFREYMIGEGTLEQTFAVFISTAVYALLALVAASWMFQREEILLSEDKGLPVTFRRSEILPRPAPTPGFSLLLFSLSILLLFYVGAYLQSLNLLWGLLATLFGLFLAPMLLLLWYVRVDLAETLSLRRAPAPALAGTVLLMGGWFILLMQLSYWQNKIMPTPPEYAEAMSKLLNIEESGVSLPFLFFTIAVAPSICEEALFRGGILAGLKGRLGFWGSIVVVGLMFGVMHLSIHRVFLTGLSGMVLTYLVLRSGSIYTGMLGHLVMNGTAVVVASGQWPALTQRFEPLEETGLPVVWLAVALVAAAAGVFLVERSPAPKERPAAASRAPQEHGG